MPRKEANAAITSSNGSSSRIGVRAVVLGSITALSLAALLGLFVGIGIWRVSRAESRFDSPQADQIAAKPHSSTDAGGVGTQHEPAAGPVPVTVVAADPVEPPPIPLARPPAARASALLLSIDNESRGGWVGRYGKQGFYVAMKDAVPHCPPGIRLTMEKATPYIWGLLTVDPRALSIAETPAQLSAGQWFSWDNFTFDLDLGDPNKSYQVELYLLDWDSNNRAQQLEVIDAATGAVLLSRIDDHFVGGRYLILKLSGHLKLKFSKTGGTNCTLSGIFFDNLTKERRP